jgi:putative pyruvate formate lyase activating enzyme
MLLAQTPIAADRSGQRGTSESGDLGGRMWYHSSAGPIEEAMLRRVTMKLTRREFVKRLLTTGGSLLLASGPLRLFAQPWRRQTVPAYARLEESGKLAQRVEQAYALFENCRCCPRQCGVNRIRDERGFCRAPSHPVVYSAHPHFGEEIPLVGTNGSGTIFFSNCNLRCVFCQNWPIAHEGRGRVIRDEDLADVMLKLQEIGCHNINLVTPTHVMPNILNATRMALQRGLRLPLVYNTSGYERLEIVKLLDGIVDIYMPDFKYTDSEKASEYSSGAADYPEVTKTAIAEMHRQVGTLQMDWRGVAVRGLIIRHLVMPNRVAGTLAFVRWVAESLGKSTYVNIMSQYHVDYRAYDYPEIARGITVEEFLEAVDWAKEYGLTNLDARTLLVWNTYRN